MMGSGKSAVGRRLAEALGASFIDLDTRVERMFGQTVAEAFAQGEPHFRARERLALQSLLDEPAFGHQGAVVATGGGTVVDPANRAAMDAVGTRVLLRVPSEVLAARLKGAEADARPLIANADDPASALRALWTARRDAYERGACIVDADGDVATVLQRVLAALDLDPQTGETSP